ncbi:MAG: hypothetical protein HKN01_01555 [Acidimicrobiia bacterium]|nr:hypothetical protein [Acidimicrobiia bacterium]
MSWFAIQHHWPPSVVYEQMMGDLRELCWRGKEANRKAREEAEERKS